MQDIKNALTSLFYDYQTRPLVTLPQGAAMAYLLPAQMQEFGQTIRYSQSTENLWTTALKIRSTPKYVLAIIAIKDTMAQYRMRRKYKCTSPATFDRAPFMESPSVARGLKLLSSVLEARVSCTLREIGASPAFQTLADEAGVHYRNITPVSLRHVVYHGRLSTSATGEEATAEKPSNGSAAVTSLPGLPVIYPSTHFLIDRVENVMRFVEEITGHPPSDMYAYLPFVAYSVATQRPVKFFAKARRFKTGVFYRMVHQRYPGTHVWVENDPFFGEQTLLDEVHFYSEGGRKPPPYPEDALLVFSPPEDSSTSGRYATVTVLPRGVLPKHDHDAALLPTPYVENPYTGAQDDIGHD